LTKTVPCGERRGCFAILKIGLGGIVRDFKLRKGLMKQNWDLLEKWKTLIIGCATTGVVLGRYKSFQLFLFFWRI
jgi:hypothetical protein